MVIDVAEKKIRTCLVNDEPQVATDSYRPEVLVLRPVELVEPHPGAGRVDLEIERRRLGELLLVRRQPGEARGEAVGDQEAHVSYRPGFITALTTPASQTALVEPSRKIRTRLGGGLAPVLLVSIAGLFEFTPQRIRQVPNLFARGTHLLERRTRALLALSLSSPCCH